MIVDTAILVEQGIHVEEEEQTQRSIGDLNVRIALWVVSHVGTMKAAYLFMGIAVIGLCAILGFFPPIVALLVVWLSQTFLQLVMLPIVLVGQGIQEGNAKHLAEAQFAMIKDTYQKISTQEEKILTLEEELLKQTRMLIFVVRTMEGRKEGERV